jgi:hypothetical protein
VLLERPAVLASTARTGAHHPSSAHVVSDAPERSSDAAAAAHMLGVVLLGACAGWLRLGVVMALNLLAT